MASKRGRSGGSRAIPMPVNDSQSVSVRKIENGFLVRSSGTKNGRYFEREVYTPKAPDLGIPAAPKRGK